jgi:hypothetical protein
METVGKAIALLTALVALLSAYIGYKALTARKQRTRPAQIHALRFKNPAVSTARVSIRRMKWSLAIPALFNFALGGIMLVTGFEPAAIMPLLVAVLSTLVIFTMRTKPPSRVMKHAEFVFEAAPKEILKQSLAALQTIGAQVGIYDSENGIIEAKDRVRWFSQGGAIITVRVHVDEKQMTCLRIESDAPIASAIFGARYHARVIQRFGEELFMLNEQPEKETGG